MSFIAIEQSKPPGPVSGHNHTSHQIQLAMPTRWEPGTELPFVRVATGRQNVTERAGSWSRQLAEYYTMS